MSRLRITILTALAMCAFAGNSLLCRAALEHAGMDAASFTTIRLISGALTLWLVSGLRNSRDGGRGDIGSALALFVYAAGFSYAYVELTAATGALLLFGAVQATMIAHGVRAGERLRGMRLLGLLLASCGLLGLLFPGLTAPPVGGAVLMFAAGIAWGIYSLRGQGEGDPVRVTAGNFLRAVPLSVALNLFMVSHSSLDAAGITYAALSGAIASGLAYAIWYTVLPALTSTSAAVVQLSVPVIAAVGGAILLSEPVTWRLILTSAAILGGIALVVLERSRPCRMAGRGRESGP